MRLLFINSPYSVRRTGHRSTPKDAFPIGTHIRIVSDCLLAPFGVFAGSYCLPVGYFILWDCGVFCGTGADFITCLVGLATSRHLGHQMQASRPLTFGAADADSTGSSYGRSSGQPTNPARHARSGHVRHGYVRVIVQLFANSFSLHAV